ncbi:MAG TPA: HU family DNA-binding protein [bacterium]|nr:HU family DNA-binding protein [bacterium]
MTKGEMLGAIAEKSAVSKKQVKEVLDAYNDLLIKTLKKDKKVKLPGIGILAVKHRKARVGRNPMTGATIQIPAKKVVKMRIAKDLKTAVL